MESEELKGARSVDSPFQQKGSFDTDRSRDSHRGQRGTEGLGADKPEVNYT